MTVQILQGDCREVLRTLSDESVNCVVTSPPYFGLRDYGVDGQIGLEPTPDAFVAELVCVFRDVRRVLRADGTLWLNLGDSYAGGGKGGNPPDSPHQKQATNKGSLLHAGLHEVARQSGAVDRSWQKPAPGWKAKDLYGIPWMVAFALRADGWYLRQDIIWSKPNPMPESVQDRCTKAHEYVFLLSKSPRYHYDADAIAEPRAQDEDSKTFRGGCYVSGEVDNGTMGKRRVPGNKSHKGTAAYASGDAKHRTKAGLVDFAQRERDADPTDFGTRNARSVWNIATQPFSEAHFATFPPELAERCIKAGCPEGGTVLDPFGGAGTTGLVADRLGRSAILIELNPAYAEIARNRIAKDAGMFAEIAS